MINEELAITDEWEFYPTRIGNLSYTVRFDMGLERLGFSELMKYPHTLELSISAMIVDTHGFPVLSELTRINAIEDDFHLGMWDFKLIGAITGGGGIRFIFCLSQEALQSVDLIVKSLMGSALHNAKYDFNLYQDDNFEFYANFLSPCVFERNWIKNRQQHIRMEENGEKFEFPRDVDFFCTFFNEKIIRVTANKLIELGFTEISVRRINQRGYQLHLIKNGIPNHDWITENTNEIIEVLLEVDAFFDGWTSTIYGGTSDESKY